MIVPHVRWVRFKSGPFDNMEVTADNWLEVVERAGDPFARHLTVAGNHSGWYEYRGNHLVKSEGERLVACAAYFEWVEKEQ